MGRLAGFVASELSTTRRTRFGRSGRNSPSGRAPASIARAVSSIEPRQNGCRPRERLPQHHADRPDVRSRRRLAAREPFRRDVRKRSGYIAGLGQRLGLGHLREPEVEHPRRDPVAVHEEDVRGLDVAVEDSGGVGVGEPVADLRAGLDRRVLGQPTVAQRLAEGVPGDELVRDVDVA